MPKTRPAREGLETDALTPSMLADIYASIKPKLQADLMQNLTVSLESDLKSTLLVQLKKNAELNQQLLLEKVSEDLKAAETQMFGQLTKQLATFLQQQQTQFSQQLEVEREIATSKWQTEMLEKQNLLGAQMHQQFDGAKRDFDTKIKASIGLEQQKLLEELTQIQLKDSAKTQIVIQNNVATFVDKTKADLKTELPSMYQASATQIKNELHQEMVTLNDAFTLRIAELQQQALDAKTTFNQEMAESQRLISLKLADEETKAVEAVKTKLGAQLPEFTLNLSNEIETNIQTSLQKSILSTQKALSSDVAAIGETMMTAHRQQLETALAATYQQLMQSTDQTLTQQVDAAKTRALGDLQTSFQASIPQLQQSAGEAVAQEFTNNIYSQGQKIKAELLADLNAELPQVERILNEKIGAILGRELPEMEENMRQKLNDEIRALLQSVKFVLPN